MGFFVSLTILSMLFSTIASYIRRSTLISASAILFLILFVILGNAFARVLTTSAEQNLDIVGIIQLVLIKGVSDLPIIIALGLMLGITLTINKLYKDSEISALHNAGVGTAHIFIALLPVLGFVSITNFFIGTTFVPELKQFERQILIANSNTTDFNFIKQNTFQNFKGGGIVIYSNNQEETNTLGETFIYDKTSDSVVLTETIGRTAGTDNKVFASLGAGTRYNGITGENTSIATFADLRLQIFQAQVKDTRSQVTIKSIPTLDLLTSKNEASLLRYQAELQERISMSIAVFSLSIIAIMFAKTRPRAKYNFSVLFSLLFFIAYISILKSTIGLIESKQLHHSIGSYSVHLIAFLIVIGWLWLQSKKGR